MRTYKLKKLIKNIGKCDNYSNYQKELIKSELQIIFKSELKQLNIDKEYVNWVNMFNDLIELINDCNIYEVSNGYRTIDALIQMYHFQYRTDVINENIDLNLNSNSNL